MPETQLAPRAERTPLLPTLVRCCTALAATPPRLLRPRRPDTDLLARLEVTDPPPARAAVRLTVLAQARTDAPEILVAEGHRSLRKYPMSYASFLVEHPKARFVIDPSMCSIPRRRVLPELPFPVPLLVAPDEPVRGLGDALDARGLSGADVEFVVPTHLHWDHVAGLLDLPGSVPVRLPAAEYEWAMGGPRAPLGVARGPLLGRAFDTFDLDGPPVFGFPGSHDLFGDGSVLMLDLSGHTPGSIGVLLAVDDGTRVLLAGDAVWGNIQIRLLREKAPMPGSLFDADRDAAFATIHRLHALPEGIEVIAGHDHAAIAARVRD
ncbi:MAG TPA: MBL fold metallo-hydrolase [Nocardia sp.]|uniref:MBL fold metallo-hydrolase n=1 Tax=Nocardia sp. TaxID=1821 RepID=UPI002B4B82A8|nr:MBL fold metallo-hydrolase [Nocardia sp.]HLS77145.1 MBL fold metallo-hydrolase [Nocardia sp.]